MNLTVDMPGAVYNVVDDDSASRAEVMAFAEQLLRGRPADVLAEIKTPSADSSRCACSSHFGAGTHWLQS